MLSTYGANAILDGTAMPATLYAQVHVGNPGVDGTANVATETGRVGFTRAAAAAGSAANDVELQWVGYPTAETISHVSLWSASTGGDVWWIVDNVDKLTVADGTLTVAVGAAVLTFPTHT